MSNLYTENLSVHYFDQICRTCLSAVDLQPLFNNDNVLEIFKTCFNMEFDENDNLPKHICLNCVDELKKVHRFFENCLNTESILKKCLTDTETNNLNGTDVNVKIENDITIEENFVPINFIKIEGNLNESDSNSYTNDSFNLTRFIDNNKNQIEEFSQKRNSEISNDTLIDLTFMCSVCEKVFKSKKLLKIHSLIHTDEKSFACDICSSRFRQRSHLTRHKLSHSDTRPFPCQLCSKRFRQRVTLQKHLATHDPKDLVSINKSLIGPHKRYKCDLCEKSFRDNHDLRIHKITHTDLRPYKCDVCNKFFKRLENLNKHKTVHTNVKPYQCDVCKRQFRIKSILKRHEDIHLNRRPNKCNECGKQFNRLYSLQLHVRLHSDVKPYQCDVCHKKFRQNSNLNTHKKLHMK